MPRNSRHGPRIADWGLEKPFCDRRLAGIERWSWPPPKDAQLRVPDIVRKCAVFLGYPIYDHGELRLDLKGTGFFVGVPSPLGIPDRHYVVLVTARHVAEPLAKDDFCVRVNLKNGESRALTFEMSKASTSFGPWIYHPDPTVDIAAMRWVFGIEDLDFAHIPMSMFLTADVAERDDVGVGDEVFTTGLFTKVAGHSRNIPIVRMGNVAMMDADRIPTKNFGMMEAYLVETRSIGGISGSPVFVRKDFIHGGKMYLMGVMHGHWDLPKDVEEENLSSDMTGPSSINMGIAITSPATKLKELLEMPVFIENMKRRDQEFLDKQAPSEDMAVTTEQPETDSESQADRQLTGDEILTNMLNTPPEPRK